MLRNRARSQTLSIALGHIRYSHIGRVESLKQDLQTISEMIGYSMFDDRRELPSVNRARGRSGFEPTAEQWRKIRQLYAQDYEAFGY